jgi:glycosyltransferase involved in cell wall biosynthesis
MLKQIHGTPGLGLRASRDTVLIGPVFPSRIKQFALALEENQRLRAFVGGYIYQPTRALEQACQVADRFLRTRTLQVLAQRSLAGVSPEHCHRAVAVDAFYSLGSRLPVLRHWNLFRQHWSQHAWIDRLAASHVDERARVVLAREDGALRSFGRAREVGARSVYDLPTAHHATVRQIMQPEEALFPGVCRRPSITYDLTEEQMAHKDAELALADHVFVGSAFVARSRLQRGFAREQITSLPSACEPSWLPAPTAAPLSAAVGSVVVLHVGYLSLRKGTHRLLRVWKRLGAQRTCRLRLIGEMCLSQRFLADFTGCYEHIPRLPREELRAHYATASVFALPAAAEGFAAVILEALSCGVPVIASRNSGADGFINHGQEGLLHDFGNDDELATHLDWLLSHPRERAEMAQYSRAKARSWTWEDYRRRFSKVLVGLAPLS